METTFLCSIIKYLDFSIAILVEVKEIFTIG